jgi:hypothetical protein
MLLFQAAQHLHIWLSFYQFVIHCLSSSLSSLPIREAKEKPAEQLVVDRQNPLQQTPIAGFENHDSKVNALNDFDAKVLQLIEIAKKITKITRSYLPTLKAGKK